MAFNSELSEVKIIFSEATPLYMEPSTDITIVILKITSCIPQILLSFTLYACHCPILIQRLINIKNKLGGERDGSAIKSTFCSYRESGFNFKQALGNFKHP